MSKFEAGKKYNFFFTNNTDVAETIKIEKRTEKSVYAVVDGIEKRFSIKLHDGCEMFYPFGKYPLSPVCKASRPS